MPQQARDHAHALTLYERGDVWSSLSQVSEPGACTQVEIATLRHAHPGMGGRIPVHAGLCFTCQKDKKGRTKPSTSESGALVQVESVGNALPPPGMRIPGLEACPALYATLFRPRKHREQHQKAYPADQHQVTTRQQDKSEVLMQVESVGNAPPPSGMCPLGRDLVFLASWGGDSLLVQASPEQPPPQVLKRSHQSCSSFEIVLIC